MDAFKRIYPEEYYLKFLEQDVRPDGRNLTDVRNTLISVGTISTANGSSFVKIGTTSVVCGIKAEVGQKQSNLKSNMGLLIYPFIRLFLFSSIFHFIVQNTNSPSKPFQKFFLFKKKKQISTVFFFSFSFEKNSLFLF